MRLLVATFLVACAAGPAPVDTPTPQRPGALPTAHEVFARSEAVYEKATSYSDRGYVMETYATARGDHRRRVTFTTAFVRGDRFRVEYRDNGDSERAHIVWHGGKRTRIKSFVDGNSVKDEPSLDLALAVANGISGGAARVVPGRLLADALGRILVPPNAHVDGTDWVDGRRCYKISLTVDGISQPARSGIDWSGYVDVAANEPVAATKPVEGIPVTVDVRSRVWWIDADTYVLRKIVQREHLKTDHGEFDVVTGIHYTPELNGTVAATDLAEPTDGTPSP